MIAPLPAISRNLIGIKDQGLRFGILASDPQEVVMPVDSILVSAAMVSMFVIFAAVLFWADLQTRPTRHETADRNIRRRAF